MCMDKLHSDSQESQSNSERIETGGCPSDTLQYHTNSVDNSPTSFDDNDTIEFGPIKVKPRKKPAPTLATGRRSKYETLTPDEELKRELRRARNRAAAERVRISRLNVEQDLQGQIDALEDQEQKLYMNIQMLEDHKFQLQTHLVTHDSLCSTTKVSNTFNKPMAPALFPSDEQISDSNFDDIFSSSSIPVQIQANVLPTNVFNDDFDDILMDF